MALPMTEITAWNNELKVQIESRNKFDSSSSEAGGSSEVFDGGDSSQLYQRRQRNESHQANTDREQLVKDTGSKFVSSSQHSQGEGTPNSRATTLRDRSPSHPDTALQLDRDVGTILEDKIEQALETSSGISQRRFLPFSKLDEIFTYEAIVTELQIHHKDWTQVDLHNLAHKVFDEVELPNSSLTTRRKIFATLVRINKPACITQFIDEGLYDSDLPFYFPNSNEQHKHVYRKTKQGAEITIPCFTTSRWKTIDREIFAQYQWEFLAPFFEVTPTNGQGKRPLHYSLGWNTILPFIEDYEKDGEGDLISGGFSEVWRVRIHPAHHSHPSSENPCFAVKRLKFSNQSTNMFKQEVSTLKRLSSQDHAHLMKLELTYDYQERFHLLFRWADGNLRDYWMKHPMPSDIPRTHTFATWVSKQWLGLAEALMKIHECPPDSGVTADDEADDLAPQRTNGRHGDIKPENILWFQSGDRSASEGRFVISDFGLTEFHRDETGAVSPMNIARSPSYRAPEYDVSETISQSYDIWTLGCVLLEFVVWYLKGFQAFDQFSKDRAAEDNGVIRQDVYFKLVGNRLRNDGRQFIEAVLKKTVASQFANLREQPDVTELLVDVLEFIEEKMLRMDPGKRATCKEVVDEFRNIYEKALADEKYCLQPVPGKPKRVNTDLSTLSPFLFDAPECVTSSSEYTLGQIRFCKPFSTPGAAEKEASADKDKARSITKDEEATFPPRPHEVLMGQRNWGQKRRGNLAPSTDGRSSGSTNRGNRKRPLAVEDDGRRAVKRRDWVQRLRSLLCW